MAWHLKIEWSDGTSTLHRIREPSPAEAAVLYYELLEKLLKGHNITKVGSREVTQ